MKPVLHSGHQSNCHGQSDPQACICTHDHGEPTSMTLAQAKAFLEIYDPEAQSMDGTCSECAPMAPQKVLRGLCEYHQAQAVVDAARLNEIRAVGM